MKKQRLEAFSDGVLAIIITIMVLEMHAPHGEDLAALRPLIPVFISYALSFIFIGIYWNNHHHLIQAAEKVNGPILWANLHLLFWLSMVPFATAWMGTHEFSAWPVAFYGIVLLCAGISYYLLAKLLASHHGKDSALARALGEDIKGRISIALYVAAIPLAFVNAWLAYALYILVALMWLCPDSRFEKIISRA